MNNYYKKKAKWEILNQKRKEQKLAKEYNQIISEIFKKNIKEENS